MHRFVNFIPLICSFLGFGYFFTLFCWYKNYSSNMLFLSVLA